MKANNKVKGFVSEVAAIVKQLWSATTDSCYCCGVVCDSPASSEPMATASSCCGVRV